MSSELFPAPLDEIVAAAELRPWSITRAYDEEQVAVKRERQIEVRLSIWITECATPEEELDRSTVHRLVRMYRHEAERARTYPAVMGFGRPSMDWSDPRQDHEGEAA